MKKVIVILAFGFLALACSKSAEVKEAKFAYIDTTKLMEEYEQAKDIEAKYKSKSEEAGRKFEIAEQNFKADAENFERSARANGEAWAQQKGAELQRRQQELQYSAQSVAQQLQQQMGTEMDSLVKDVKTFIKDYGKKNGYKYIFGTGEAATVLYGEEKDDITKEIIKLLNEKYKAAPAKETAEKK